MPPSFWEQHGGAVIAGSVGAMAVLAFLIWWRRQPQPTAVTPADVAARRALEALRGRPEDEALVAEVSRLLRRYLLAAFFGAADEWTTDEVLTALGREVRLDAERRAALGALLRECEAREFAPIQPAPKPELVARSLELVNQCEALRRAVAPASPPPPPQAPAPPPAA